MTPRRLVQLEPYPQPWEPDWVVAPAEILREWLDERGLSPNVLAVACGRIDPTIIHAVLDKQPITPETAEALQRGTGIYARMWLALEHGYRQGLRAGKTEGGQYE